MYLGDDGNIDCSLTRAGYLAPGVPGHGARHGARAQAVRQAAVEGRRDAGGASSPTDGFVLSASLARGLNGEVNGRGGAGGPMRRSPRPSRRTASPAAATGRPAIASSSPISARRLTAIATDGPDAFYTGWIADRIAEDMATQRRPHHQGRSRGVPGEGARADQGHVPRLRDHLDAAAELGRRRARRDAQHARGARDSEEAARLRRSVAPRHRGACGARISIARAILGDPDFGEVPVARLISKPHAAALAKTIDPTKASSSVELGQDIVTVTSARRSRTRRRTSR